MRTYATILPRRRSALRVGVCLLLSSAQVYAVELQVVPQPEPLSEAWRWTEFVVPGVVDHIFEDRDGVVWFATNKGLVNYDGYAFKTLTTDDGLGSTIIRAVTQARDGALWVGTRQDGITRLGVDSVRTYTTEDGLASNHFVWKAVVPSREDGLWAGSDALLRGTGGLSYFDGRTWSVIPSPIDTLSVITLIEAKDGALWVSSDQGLLRFRGGEWTRFGPDEGLTPANFDEIIQASDGSIWATAFDEPAIARYKDQRWTIYGPEDGLREDNHGSIWEERDGHLWSASYRGDFVTFTGERWRAVDSARNPTRPYGVVSRDGILWIYSWAQSITYRVRLEGASRIRFDVGRVLRGGHNSGVTWFVNDDGPACSTDGNGFCMARKMVCWSPHTEFRWLPKTGLSGFRLPRAGVDTHKDVGKCIELPRLAWTDSHRAPPPLPTAARTVRSGSSGHEMVKRRQVNMTRLLRHGRSINPTSWGRDSTSPS